jgi:protoheme IX farnesyltransferase
MASQPLVIARNYLDLTKPRLLPLVLFTGIPAMGMAAGTWPSLTLGASVLLGIALAAASANTLNAYIEWEADGRAERTRERPIPSGRIAPTHALVFGIVLALLSTWMLWAVSGPAAAGLGVASILFYIFVYTIWLKPRSAWNAVIGGAAGAVAPLIADVAVNGSIGWGGLSLFAIVFFWQPPHVWAIALYRKSDYEASGTRMLPSVIGDQPTRWRMLWYTIGLVPITLSPWLLGYVGPLYLVVACAMSVWFVWAAVEVLREKTDAAARRMFRVSLAFMFGVFSALLADLLLFG